MDVQIENRRVMSGSNDPDQLRTYSLPVAIVSHCPEICNRLSAYDILHQDLLMTAVDNADRSDNVVAQPGYRIKLPVTIEFEAGKRLVMSRCMLCDRATVENLDSHQLRSAPGLPDRTTATGAKPADEFESGQGADRSLRPVLFVQGKHQGLITAAP